MLGGLLWFLDVGRSELWCCKFVSPEVALDSLAEEVKDGMYVCMIVSVLQYSIYKHV